MVGYIFGGDTGETPESLKRKRDIAMAMLGQSSTPKNVGEGLNAIGNAIVYRAMMGDVQKGEEAGRKSADAAFAPIASLLGGGGSSAPSTMPMPGAASEIGAGAPNSVKPGGVPEISDYIKQAAIARGIDPEIALRVAGHEGLNVFDPSKPDNGGDEGSSFGPFQLHYAGMSKSMPNSGLGDEFTKATGLHARDPSTWKKQVDFSLDWARKNGWSPWMGAKAEGITGMMGIGAMPSTKPGEVASLDPAAGIPMPGAQGQMRASSPALPAPTTVTAPSPVAAQPPVAPAAQVAQVMSSQQPSIDLGAVTKALNNPFLTPGQRAVAQSILQQEMDRRSAQYEQQLKQSDPAYRQNLEKGQIELDNLRNPKMSPSEAANLKLNQDKFAADTANNEARLKLDRDKFDAEVQKGQWQKLTDGRLYNQTTGDFRDAPPPVPGSTPMKFDDISGVRKEIQQLPSYKNLAQAAPIYKSMVETAGRSSKASDLNLVYGLGKIMDPTSVVREGEMVMVKNTASIPDWFQGVIASLNGGAALTPETRQAIMKEAYGRVQGYSDEFGRNIEQYRGIAQRNNMNEADIIPPIDKFEPWKAPETSQPGSPVQIQSVDDYNSLPKGTQYLDPNGKLRTKQ